MMRVRATTRYKNDRIFKHRKEHGLTQIQYSQILGISLEHLQYIENMHCEAKKLSDDFIKAISLVALDLDCSEEDIWPDWLHDLKIGKKVEVAEIDNQRLEYYKKEEIKELTYNKNLLYQTLEDIKYDNDCADKDQKEYYGEREKDILKMKYGLKPYDRQYSGPEIGKKWRICRETVRHIECKILRKLRRNIDKQRIINEANT